MIQSIQAIRLLGLDMVEAAQSGHPGIVLGAAPMLYQLYNHHMITDPTHPEWFNRDRFVMSSGHGSALFYSVLHLGGFGLTIEDLQGFRRYGSMTPGHPEYRHTKGVDATTGPLGQGISMAVGMAIAEEHLRARFNEPEFPLVDHYTYVFTSDGDLQEGIAMEALALAGHFQLGRLIMLYDSNDTQLNGPTAHVSSTHIKSLCEAFNLEYFLVGDANDTKAIHDAIEAAKQSDRPTLIEVKSVLAYGSLKAGQSVAHGAPLGDEEVTRLRALWQPNSHSFDILEEVYDDFRTHLQSRGASAHAAWRELWENYQQQFPQKAELFKQLQAGHAESLPIDLPSLSLSQEPEATRVSGGKILELFSLSQFNLMGGSADLSSSTRVKGINGLFSHQHRLGRNLDFGVREHAMGAIVNGLTLHHLRGFSGGFFTFSDYMKPAIRLAALMGLPSLFIFTHDSIAIGEDGPTHQPVEQLSQFRAMPQCLTLRPADAKETYEAFKLALNTLDRPSVVVLSRQNLPRLPHVDSKGFTKGAYAVKAYQDASGVLLASGSEVSLALAASETLSTIHDMRFDVVSVPSLDLFLKQSKEYQESLLKPALPLRIAIEMGSSGLWYQVANRVIGQDRFGQSGKGSDIVKHFGFTKDDVLSKIIAFIKT